MSDEIQSFGTGAVLVEIVDAYIGKSEKGNIYAAIVGQNNNGRQKTGRLFMSEKICQTGNNKGKTWKEINLDVLKKIGLTDPRRIGEQLKGKQCSFSIEIEKEEGKADIEVVGWINPISPRADMAEVTDFFKSSFDMSGVALETKTPESASSEVETNPFDDI